MTSPARPHRLHPAVAAGLSPPRRRLPVSTVLRVPGSGAAVATATATAAAAAGGPRSESPPAYSDDDPIAADAASELLQPAISPIATRLASPLTPSAEKAAWLGGGVDGTVESALAAAGGEIEGEGDNSDVDSDEEAEAEAEARAEWGARVVAEGGRGTADEIEAETGVMSTDPPPPLTPFQLSLAEEMAIRFRLVRPKPREGTAALTPPPAAALLPRGDGPPPGQQHDRQPAGNLPPVPLEPPPPIPKASQAGGEWPRRQHGRPESLPAAAPGQRGNENENEAGAGSGMVFVPAREPLGEAQRSEGPGERSAVPSMIFVPASAAAGEYRNPGNAAVPDGRPAAAAAAAAAAADDPGPAAFRGRASTVASVSGGDPPKQQQQQQRRSGSSAEGALKRFQKAFPSFSSIQIPSSLRPTFPSSLRMAAPISLRRGSTDQDDGTAAARPHPPSDEKSSASPPAPQPSPPPRPRWPLRRVTSDDSLLYHRMSMTSAFDDEEEGRFAHIHSMASVRMMAIRESLPDRPSFKLPGLPRLAGPLKRSAGAVAQSQSTPSTPPAPPQQQQQQSSTSTSTSPPPPSTTTLPKVRARASPLPPDGAAAGPSGSPSPTAALDRVLETLTGDVVVLGGYRGSVLRSADPPHQQLWAPVKVGLNMRKVDLEVGLDPADEEAMEQRIVASGMLQNIGPIDVSRRLIRRMRGCEAARAGRLRVWDYGYDWRLSPALLSRRLERYIEGLVCNSGPAGAERPAGAYVIAHSLGGLITRHVVNRRPELFAGVVYAGTPQRCVNILGPIRNGDPVLLNEKILTARVNFSLRTTFAFLPEDGACFIDRDTGEDLRIDFYDVEDWIRYRLSPCVEHPPLLSPPSRSSTTPLAGRFPTIGLPLRRKEAAAGSGAERRTAGAAATAATAATDSLSSSSSSLALSSQAGSSSLLSPPATGAGAPRRPSSPTRAESIAYLSRTLAATKQFRAELAFRPELEAANAYPPLAVIYGKNVPTVYAARVVGGRDGIGRADAYDDLVFRGGDGVVLAREAMLPDGYALVRGGRVRTERGHVTMLGDLAATGRALEAVVRGRRKGIGWGHGPDVRLLSRVGGEARARRGLAEGRGNRGAGVEADAEAGENGSR